MLRHIGGKAVDDANLTATTKVQKKIVRDFITGDGRKKAEGWLPRYMEFPFNSPLKKALLTGFHSTAKHNATKAVSPSSETMRTI